MVLEALAIQFPVPAEILLVEVYIVRLVCSLFHTRLLNPSDQGLNILVSLTKNAEVIYH